MTARLLCLGLIALGGAAACGSGGPTSTGKCTQTSQCAAGQFCNAAGFCQGDLGCTASSQCTNGQSCDVGSGQCFCKNDQQCPLGQTCNAAGKCQITSACNANADCASGFLCDTASHGCIPTGSCAQDVQCPQGQVCNSGACQPGCASDGDCVLIDYSQTPPAPTPAACINFQCVAGGCHSQLNCGIYGVCQNNQCQSVCGHSQFCQSCDPTNPSACPDNGFCLEDPANNASCDPTNPTASCKYFCGLDCSAGQQCPNGAFCAVITVIAPGTDGPGQACNVGDTCTGQQNTPCPVQEGQQSGACPCYQDGDCPLNPNTLSNYSCQQGACVAGAQCGPDKQYTCQTNSCGGG